jgi:hypothetical protein
MIRRSSPHDIALQELLSESFYLINVLRGNKDLTGAAVM